MSEPLTERELRVRIKVSRKVAEILSDAEQLREFERRLTDAFLKRVAQRLDDEIMGKSEP